MSAASVCFSTSASLYITHPSLSACCLFCFPDFVGRILHASFCPRAFTGCPHFSSVSSTLYFLTRYSWLQKWLLFAMWLYSSLHWGDSIGVESLLLPRESRLALILALVKRILQNGCCANSECEPQGPWSFCLFSWNHCCVNSLVKLGAEPKLRPF
jgi:hypothetical protein